MFHWRWRFFEVSLRSRVERVACTFWGGAKISAEVISRPEFVHVRVAINRNYRWGLALMGHVRGVGRRRGRGPKSGSRSPPAGSGPDADPVCDLIDKSSIFCIKSSQLYISVAPVTISDNSIYLSHIMPIDVFWHFEPFHILISNIFVVKACLKIVPKRLFTSSAQRVGFFNIGSGRVG